MKPGSPLHSLFVRLDEEYRQALDEQKTDAALAPFDRLRRGEA